MADPTLIAGAAAIVITALTAAAVTVINAVSKAKLEMLAKMAEVKDKVDGNFTDVKEELRTANQRIAVLTERLLTTTATDKNSDAGR